MAIHPTAIIDPQAELDAGVEVGPYCVIEAHVRVAAGSVLTQNVCLTGWTEIGERCVLHPGVIVGHSPQDFKYRGERSYCRIGRDNVLREFVTVHRGTTPESVTRVGDGCLFDGGSHVAHNCTVGDRVVLSNQALLAGHVTVGNGVVIGPFTGVHQFVRIGEHARIGDFGAVSLDVIPFALIDSDGRVAGVNTEGLERAACSPAEREEIERAYRMLYREDVHFKSNVDRLASGLNTPAGGRLLDFLRGESRRGYAGRPRPRAASPRRCAAEGRVAAMAASVESVRRPGDESD